LNRNDAAGYKKSPIYRFEPYVFIFFGIFHLHRIWGLLNRRAYASFWLGLLDNRGGLYFLLMGTLALLCIAGIAVFIKHRGQNYWWRWIYLFGGAYLLFDLFAILIKLEFWDRLLRLMFDITGRYWNLIWGSFSLIGLLSLILGLHLLKQFNQTH
jgi:hypothetical protein